MVAFAQLLGAKGAVPLSEKKEVTGAQYAIVVGISDYQNPSIPDLKFADRDARAFAQYLADPDGGGMDSTRIQLLLNEQATAGRVIMALYAMIEKAKEGDLVIFYFSGHGDVETKTLNQPGFLLCWDAPSSVYMVGGTFGLVYLQEIISTLYVNNKAKVLMITDACRSGKLAGESIGGHQLTAANLSKQFANEMKLLSCQPNELSLEGQKWGGGRGVFSYYLLQGMQGKADRNADKIISLFEIERYLEDEVSRAVSPQNQLPMAIGNKSEALVKVRSEMKPSPTDSLPAHPGELLAVRGKGVQDIMADIKNPVTADLYSRFRKSIESRQLLYPSEGSAWYYLQQLKSDTEMTSRIGTLQNQLAAALLDETQQAINDYLKSDPAELRKRWSYDERYEHYPEFLEKAQELLGEMQQLGNGLKARQHYFTGLNLRLKGEQTKEKSLYELARKEQELCIRLEPNAAFAYNELGLLDRRIQNYKAAIANFESAIEMSPQWALPHANLCSSNNDLGQYDEAVHHGLIACALDSVFPLAHYNLGCAYLFSKSYIPAAESFENAIRLDSFYANSYFNLSLVYYALERFTEAKSMIQFYLKLKNKDPMAWLNLGEIELKLGSNDAALKHFNHALQLDPGYDAAYISLAEYHISKGDLAQADSALLQCIRVSPDHALAYFYLASNSGQNGKTELALNYFGLSFEKGFNDWQKLERDPSFKIMSPLPQFKSMLEKYRANRPD